MLTPIRIACALAFVAFATPARPACEARSSSTRGTLIELYTSEGCSSCPPADRALRAPVPEGVVPIAWHVDYWDSIGWRDRFARPAFGARQSWEVHANGGRTSFTPHFFVDGRELDDWRSDLVRAGRDGGRPSARIDLRSERVGDALRVRVDATSPEGSALYVALTEDGLRSRVSTGENRGAVLEHDHVVRQWIGPVPVVGGRASIEQSIDVAPYAADRIAVAAFVQDVRTAEVRDVVSTGRCVAGR